MDIQIRKFTKEDIANKVRWINDSANNQYLHFDLPIEYEKTCVWFEKIKDRKDRYDAVIEADGVPVGLIGLLSIEDKNRKAEYYISMGESSYKGKGIAKKASLLLLEYAFRELKLKKVYLYTEKENRTAQYLFRKIGFQEEGLLKQDIFYDGRWKDRYVFGITREEYLAVGMTTPIQKLGGYGDNYIYMKRDDLIPISFGGNKARKAVYFFREIDEGGYDCVVTYGSSSSNHCRIISNIAATRRLPCYIISPEEASEVTFNSKMMELFGAEITVVPVEKVHDTIMGKMKRLHEQGRKPYFIAGGGHGNLGTQAYVDCYEEIRQYEKENMIHFDYIFFASGTGSTQAGLACGQLMCGEDRKIIGISIARKNPRGMQAVLDSIAGYLDAGGYRIPEIKIRNITIFIDSYTSDGYGKDNVDIKDTIQEVLVNYGIPLDSTYTGKAYTGMKKYVKEQGVKGKNILFIHTGGTPLFFDDIGKMNR